MRLLSLTGVLAILTLALSLQSMAREPGQPAPRCDLTAFDSSEALDIGQFRGKVLYVDFWASWCGPCTKSFPFLNTMDKEFRARGLQILGVNVDDDIESARAFLAQRPASFVLAGDTTRQCPKEFGVKAMPSAYLVDRTGTIRHVLVGFRTGDAARIRSLIEELLSEPIAVP
jgi:peroxiredoxin